MIKRMLMMLVLVGVVLGGLFGFKAFVGGKIIVTSALGALDNFGKVGIMAAAATVLSKKQ